MLKNRKLHGFTLIVWLVIILGLPVQAKDRPPVPPNTTPIPVVSSMADAETALETARRAGTALVADLMRGHEGLVVRAATASPLAPGRYRLHALVATTPHEHILVDAVAVRLTAGANSDTFDRVRRFRQPGKLAPVYLDFTVKDTGAVPITAAWFVGDSLLDRNKYRQVDEARKAYRLQRQVAINDLFLKDDPERLNDIMPDPADEQPSALRPMDGDDLPPYRLLLCGLVVERLSPVSVVSVKTDMPAYELAATGRVSATLHNWSTEPVQAPVTWSVEDDAHPGVIVARHTETVALAAGEQRELVLTDPLHFAGITRLGIVRVEAGLAGLRPDAACIPFVVLPKQVPSPERPRKVFAHYMGCYPAGTGATRYHRQTVAADFRHDRGDNLARRGGRFRNFDLTPIEKGFTAEESADLEIRRAMRIGIDGFAIDAWAGGDGAKQVFDMLITVAAKKNYPFEVTVCLDPSCGGNPAGTVQEVLQKYGTNPKLARRDGKPLIFTYFSHAFGMGALYAAIDERTPADQREAEVNRLRATELGWHLIGQSFRKAQEQIGQPICFEYDLVYFFHNVDSKLIKPGMQTRAAAAIARHVQALGSFGAYGFGYGDKVEDVAKAVRAAGAEWSGLGGMHQKENLFPGGGEVFMPKATEWLRGMWSDMRRDQATLIQLITWNDYTENTSIAPAYNTRYTIYDLTGYYIDWWKTGKQPEVTKDRVYLTYAKYPKDARAFPFKILMRSDRALEVLTLLTAPATVRLPGRGIAYEAPAGLHVKQFPITPGPVIAEIIRDGKVVERLESPEPITDKPFREDNAMVCFSTEEQRHWQADFGDTPPNWYSEYGDQDGDGLPNWYEMYWFGKWLDFSTATKAKPDDDPKNTEKTNLQHYLDQSDPTIKPAPADPEEPKF